MTGMTRSYFILIMSDKNQETASNNKFYELPAIALLKTTLVLVKTGEGKEDSHKAAHFL